MPYHNSVEFCLPIKIMIIDLLPSTCIMKNILKYWFKSVLRCSANKIRVFIYDICFKKFVIITCSYDATYLFYPCGFPTLSVSYGYEYCLVYNEFWWKELPTSFKRRCWLCCWIFVYYCWETEQVRDEWSYLKQTGA